MEVTLIIAGKVTHCIGDPMLLGEKALASNEALAITASGTIAAIGKYPDLCRQFPAAEKRNYLGCYIVPGFVDCHVHFSQIYEVATPAADLLDWLRHKIWPAEIKFSDPAFAREAATDLFKGLLAYGTTTANVFGSQFYAAMNAAYEVAEGLGCRAIMGLNLSDRHIPDELQLSPEVAYRQSRALIKRWHGRNNGRLLYAVTPRFAPTSSREQLAACGTLVAENPGVYMHTHLSESRGEMAWMAELFPGSSYTAVYRDFGLLGERSIFAHAIHCGDAEIELLAHHHCAVCHCATSNSFLGSGFCPLQRYWKAGVRVGLGSDVGAGTGFNMLRETSAAYFLQMLLESMKPGQGVHLSGAQLLYMATLGGAWALGLDDQIGNFTPGKAADLVVLDPRLDSLTQMRLRAARSAEDAMFALAIMAPRIVRTVYVGGERKHAVRLRRRRALA